MKHAKKQTLWEAVEMAANFAGYDKKTFNVWKCRGYVPPHAHFGLVETGIITLKELNSFKRKLK